MWLVEPMQSVTSFYLPINYGDTRNLGWNAHLLMYDGPSCYPETNCGFQKVKVIKGILQAIVSKSLKYIFCMFLKLGQVNLLGLSLEFLIKGHITSVE